MICRAQSTDRDGALILLREYHAVSGFANGNGSGGFVVPYSAAHLEQFFMEHLLPDRICLLLKPNGIAKGILLATAFDHPFGPVRVAKEEVWWINPSYRGRYAKLMLDAYEAWVREQGCQFSGLASMAAEPRVSLLYSRRGYRVAETHYLKAT